MSDDIKERLLNESFKGQEAMRREALARIEALEAQFAAAREALEPFAKLADHTKYSHRDSRPMIYAFDTCLGQAITVGHLRKARAALASLPAPEAAPTREKTIDLTLTADFTKSLLGGALDDSAYEQIEDALDAIDAPMTDNGRYMTLVERILALKSAPAK